MIMQKSKHSLSGFDLFSMKVAKFLPSSFIGASNNVAVILQLNNA